MRVSMSSTYMSLINQDVINVSRISTLFLLGTRFHMRHCFKSAGISLLPPEHLSLVYLFYTFTPPTSHSSLELPQVLVGQ